MDTLSAISEPSRRKILELLAVHGGMNATRIGESFKSSAPAISQHLKILRDANVVSTSKNGRQRIYELNPKALIEPGRWIASLTSQWQHRLDRLDAVATYHSQLTKRKGSK
jgi:DNA-binding transcriptional ArsR family regulator